MCSQPEGGKAWGAHGHSPVRSKSSRTNLISSYDRVTVQDDKEEIYIIYTEKAMAPHSSTPAWKLPWTEEPGRLQSMGSLRVGHN